MTQKQIKNTIELCKGNDISSIRQLLSYYRPSDLKDMANELGINGDDHDLKDRLAFALANHA